MSRIGKEPVVLPAGVTATVDGQKVTVKGKLGELSYVMHSGITAEVKDGKVATVTVGDNSETQGIGSKAIEQLPDAIVKANGTEGVDAVSGATVTSKAIFSAVDEILDQAKA